MCLVCTDLVALDAEARELGRAACSEPVYVAVAPDDATYTLARGSTFNAAHLVALSPPDAQAVATPSPASPHSWVGAA